ncbi:hypothetical protein BGZ73_007772 [Actinomortierella ambigua]|nr:hypothetical protein BGZ73_007772 [Actinomortierella ambigua]
MAVGSLSPAATTATTATTTLAATSSPATAIAATNVPDPVVMEFISKIGQIVIKARTMTPPLLTVDHLAQPSSRLDTVLQDRELWRNHSSVYLNIFHGAQFALLERWVISFTPPVRPPVAADCVASASPASHASPSSASPVTLLMDLGASGPMGGTPSSASVTSTSRKTTNDLILLVQSLYTQIRALPLNSCLTSFDEATRVTKEQLDYTVTSGHEDLTQSCQPPVPSQAALTGEEMILDMDGNPLQDPVDVEMIQPQQTRSRPPLEFLADASLKLVQFEASHKSWGCVRVTGMYDESVGGRIKPEDFQDATKALRTKSHRRSKNQSSSSSKSASRKHRLTSVDSNSTSTAANGESDDAEVHCAKYAHSEADSSPPRKLQPTKQSSPPRGFSTRTSQRPMSPVPTEDDLAHHQTSSLIRHGLLPALYPSNETAVAPSHHALQQSLRPTVPATTVADQLPMTKLKTSAEPFQFPAPLSPPLSIPEIGTKSTDSAPSQQPKVAGLSLDIQRPPPPQPFAFSQATESTSPVRYTINRRRSSRLSIVMNRGDLSPEPTSPTGMSRMYPSSPLQGRDMDVDTPYARSYHRPSSSKSSLGLSPTKHSYLRRNSLNPTLTGGDLFGSLVGSYEESILSGRMSTMPSKPLTFTAQIGVLASQDYKDCPAKLRCPRHVQLEFPAVFYDYDSSSHYLSPSQHHQHHYHGHHHHHQSPSLSNSASKGSHHSAWFTANPNSSASTSSHQQQQQHQHGSLSHSQSHSHHGWLPSSLAYDDPVLPYVGNVDLDNGFRGSKRFAKMPGGMRIPLQGQVQVMIKNPNKTVVKVFLVPYDFSDMTPNTKTFLRQKYYSVDQGIPALTSSSSSSSPPSSATGSTAAPTQGSSSSGSGGTLRYAIHLQFCCPAEGYVYLYRTIRVVFANRVPDGKEKLRIVLEGLGAGNQRSSTGTTTSTSTVLGGEERVSEEKVPVEQKYVPMRKGEVLFSGRKKRRPLPSDDGDHSVEASPRIYQQQHLHSPKSPPSHQQLQQHVVHNPHHPLHAQVPSHHRPLHSIHPHAQYNPHSPNHEYPTLPPSSQGLNLGLGFSSSSFAPSTSPLYPAQKWTLGQIGPNGEMQTESVAPSSPLHSNNTGLQSRFDSRATAHSLAASSSSMAISTATANLPLSPPGATRQSSPIVGVNSGSTNSNTNRDWRYFYQTDADYQDIPTSVLIGTPATLKSTSSHAATTPSSSPVVKATPYASHPFKSSTFSVPPPSSSSSTSPSSPPSSSMDRFKAAVSNVGEEVLRIKSLAHGLKQMGVRSPPSGAASPSATSRD